MTYKIDIRDRNSYWNNYYSQKLPDPISRPTSFAMQVNGKITRPSIVFDIGCGNGRDSIYFADQGHSVIAIDGCDIAIAGLAADVAKRCPGNVNCIAAKISDPDLVSKITLGRQNLTTGASNNSVVYARFFLHAITQLEQEAFLAVAVELLGDAGLIAVEFRTCEDQNTPKTTRPHYRRYIDPTEFIKSVSLYDLRPLHFQQGRGLAVHGVDDAHVARILLVRNDSSSRQSD